jgi:integrase/recombinase XerD
LLYHGLRRAELNALHLADLQKLRGVHSLRVHGKSNKIRYLTLHSAVAGTVVLDLEAGGHATDRPPY